MEKNMAIAYQEEQSYIQDRLNGIETSLAERLAKHGYTIEEYQLNKDNYIFELLSPKIMDVNTIEILNSGVTSGDYVLNIMNENNKHAMIFEPFLINPIAMVGLKKEIYEYFNIGATKLDGIIRRNNLPVNIKELNLMEVKEFIECHDSPTIQNIADEFGFGWDRVRNFVRKHKLL